MDNTLEVRWFFPGTAPTPVEDWITGLGAEPESERTDLYLISDDPEMNVKLRQGKVQTKHRLGEGRPLEFATGGAGPVQGVGERWVKWSFPLTGRHELHDDDPTGLWVPVSKRRLQLEVDDDEQPALLDTLIEDDPTDAAIELTHVRAGDSEAWSVCVESEGDPERLAGTLRQMGDFFFQNVPRAFPRTASYGYAQWLKNLQ